MTAPSYIGLRLHGNVVGPLPPPIERGSQLPPRDRHPPVLYRCPDGTWRCGCCRAAVQECACP
jgi:hypothetical protein